MGLIVRPSKILYITPDLFIGGGAEGMLTRMVTAQPSLADDIIVASLLPGESHADQIRAAGATVVELDFRGLRGALAGLFRLARLIRESQPEIVQGWMYHGDLVALLALVLSGRRKQTRLVWSIRCSEMDLNSYGLGLRVAVNVCRWLSRWPDVITANSVSGLKFHIGLGYRPRRAEVTPNGIDTDTFKPDPAARAAMRQELGLADDALVVAHVARVDPMKDHASLLAAMAELPDLRVLLIGPGTESLPETRNALRLGRRRDVARLLAASDIVVSSSRFGEGFSNALAEGMACGLPAVATKVGDAELIVGDSGIVVPPGDPRALTAAIRTLMQEPAAQRAARGKRARAHIVEAFTMVKILQQYAELYGSLSDRAPAKIGSVLTPQ